MNKPTFIVRVTINGKIHEQRNVVDLLSRDKIDNPGESFVIMQVATEGVPNNGGYTWVYWPVKPEKVEVVIDPDFKRNLAILQEQARFHGEMIGEIKRIINR